mgnify:CR=1 FL=1
MIIKPCGPHILIEVLPVEVKSAGGIVMHSENEAKREHSGRDIGWVRALGNTAFQDLPGCTAGTPSGRAAQWGFKIGDLIEFRRYDGKIPRLADKVKEYENYRLITDTDILAVSGE